MKRRRRSWRGSLGAAILVGIAGKLASAGCAAGTDGPSKVNSLRVLVTTADKPYANPGDTVHFTMEVHDGGGTGGAEGIQIAWIGGCFDPPGDLYYACFESIDQANIKFGIATSSDPSILNFDLDIPEDIVTRRPLPQAGPYYGIAYVFFAACAGTLRPVTPAPGVPSLPFGCFDADGNELGADRFVPGYTQIYSFHDGRPNTNPEADGLLFDGSMVKTDQEDPAGRPVVKACPLTDDERRNPGCSAPDPYESCTSYGLDVIVGDTIAEQDAQSPSPKGGFLSEVVWVDYLADKGDLDGEVKLLVGAVEGSHDDHGVRWIPPAEPGVATLWAILRDNRGGASVLRRSVRVDP